MTFDEANPPMSFDEVLTQPKFMLSQMKEALHWLAGDVGVDHKEYKEAEAITAKVESDGREHFITVEAIEEHFKYELLNRLGLDEEDEDDAELIDLINFYEYRLRKEPGLKSSSGYECFGYQFYAVG